MSDSGSGRKNEESDDDFDYGEDSRKNNKVDGGKATTEGQLLKDEQADEAFDVSDDGDVEVQSDQGEEQQEDEQNLSAEATPPQKQAHKPKFEPIRASVNNDTDEDKDEKQGAGGYDPSEFDNLDVSSEVRDLFKYITRYQPTTMDLETHFKPFIPEYIPAVGEVDAFLKPARPDEQTEALGLLTIVKTVMSRGHGKTVAGAQRAVSSIENAEKNPKEISSWIQGVSSVSRLAPSVGYTKPFPDIDTLMQVWPADIEDALQNLRLPTEEIDMTLEEYSRLCCGLVDIPVHATTNGRNLIESLHVYFTLYAEFKANQHFQQNEQFVYEGGAPDSAY